MIYLFDIDGTILLTGGAGTVAINSIFRERYQIDGAMDAIRAGGNTDPGIMREIFRTRLQRDPTDREVAEVLDAYIPRLRAAIDASTDFRLMPCVVEILDYLAHRPDVLLGIATGNLRAGARAKLDHDKLWHRFSFGGYGDDSGHRPELVAAAIRRGRALTRALTDSDVAARDIIVVGDTPRDVHAAQACGIRVIAVATGSADRPTLAATKPDAVFDTLAELPAWHESEYGET